MPTLTDIPPSSISILVTPKSITLCYQCVDRLSPSQSQKLLEAVLFSPLSTIGTILGPIAFQELCENF